MPFKSTIVDDDAGIIYSMTLMPEAAGHNDSSSVAGATALRPAPLRRRRVATCWTVGLGPTPIVFMTAKAMPAKIKKFKDLDALDVIPKPFDPMTLSDRIKAIWNAHHE